MGLIDANELLERMKTIENFSNQKGMFAVVQKMIENAPTVDAVPVVRCKDCRFWNSFPTASATPYIHECGCRYPRRGTSGNDYCSWGKRKDETD